MPGSTGTPTTAWTTIRKGSLPGLAGSPVLPDDPTHLPHLDLFSHIGASSMGLLVREPSVGIWVWTELSLNQIAQIRNTEMHDGSLDRWIC